MSTWRVRLEPFITPIFRMWWRFSRAATLGARCLVLDGEGRILLVRHTYLPGWHMPGGGVERGETAAHAIAREVAEEGGVEAIGLPQLIGLYSNHANFAGDHIALYKIDTWRPCAPREGNEIAERRWYAPNALPEDTARGTRRRLAEIYDGAELSPHW